MKIKVKIMIMLIAVYPLLFSSVLACPQCRAQVKNNIYQDNFEGNLFVMLLPLLIIGLIGVAIFFADKLKKKLPAISKIILLSK